ncbi:MAG: TonB-dependent receptor, partial [Gammaproteobacteria bacterium]|nr:TonB-dependent receptor [Gammaproteobacteria bacterium]
MTSPHRFSPLRSGIAIALATVMALPVLAPVTAEAATDELITTTARGRTEDVQDVPAAIAVISQDDIQALGIERVGDYVNLVPGVTLVDAAEVGDTQINIRGINGARDAENSVALVIDGILMTNPAAVNREYTNLQQIEIMKGPQGALYGRNAAAGAIIITTQQPGEEFSVKARASVAEDSTYLVLGNMSGPIGDNWGWSLGGDFRKSDGFYQNISCNQAPCSDTSNLSSTDGVTDAFEGWNVDGRLIADLTDNWTLDGKFRYGEVAANSITFNSVFHLPLFANLGFGDAWYENVNDHPFQFNTNVISFNNQDATELSLKSTTDMEFGQLTIWGLYSKIDNNLAADGTSGAFGFFFQDPACRQTTAALQGFPLNDPQYLGPVPEFPNSAYGAYTPTTCDGTQYQERNQKDYSLEIRLTSNDDQAVRWSAGLYYLNIEREVGVNTGVDSGTGVVSSLYIPNNGAPGVNNATEQLIWDRFDTDVFAIFGSIDWDITDTVTAGAALRYDREDREAKSLVPTDARSQYINCGLTNPYV